MFPIVKVYHTCLVHKKKQQTKKRSAGEIFHAISLLKTTHNIYFLFSSNKHILIKCTQNQKPHHNVINI